MRLDVGLAIWCQTLLETALFGFFIFRWRQDRHRKEKRRMKKQREFATLRRQTAVRKSMRMMPHLGELEDQIMKIMDSGRSSPSSLTDLPEWILTIEPIDRLAGDCIEFEKDLSRSIGMLVGMCYTYNSLISNNARRISSGRGPVELPFDLDTFVKSVWDKARHVTIGLQQLPWKELEEERGQRPATADADR